MNLETCFTCETLLVEVHPDPSAPEENSVIHIRCALHKKPRPVLNILDPNSCPEKEWKCEDYVREELV